MPYKSAFGATLCNVENLSTLVIIDEMAVDNCRLLGG